MIEWFQSGDGRWTAWGCPNCDLWFVWPPESGRTDPSGRAYFESEEYLETVDDAYVAHRERHIRRFQRIIGRATRQLSKHTSEIRAADVGSGIGTSVAAMDAMGIKAVGCDFSRRLVDRGTEIYPDIELRCGTSDVLEDAAYDMVTAFNLIEHVRDCHGLVDSLQRALKPGGILVLETPDRYSLFQSLLAGIRRLGLCYHTLSQDGGHIYLFSRRPLARLLTGHGLVIEDVWTMMSPLSELMEKTRRRKGRLAAAALRGTHVLSRITGRKNRLVVVARKTT